MNGKRQEFIGTRSNCSTFSICAQHGRSRHSSRRTSHLPFDQATRPFPSALKVARSAVSQDCWPPILQLRSGAPGVGGLDVAAVLRSCVPVHTVPHIKALIAESARILVQQPEHQTAREQVSDTVIGKAVLLSIRIIKTAP